MKPELWKKYANEHVTETSANQRVAARREEIRAQIRGAVRAELQPHDQEVRDEAAKFLQQALDNLKDPKAIDKLLYSVAKNVLANDPRFSADVLTEKFAAILEEEVRAQVKAFIRDQIVAKLNVVPPPTPHRKIVT